MLKMYSRFFSSLIALLFLLTPFYVLSAQDDTSAQENLQNRPEDSPSFQDNEFCLRCHASKYFVLSDSASGQSKRQAMCDNYTISKTKFYNSVHRSFACTDCHSSEYTNFPHASALRFEPKMSCIDCHGGDESTAQYHFEEIEDDYAKSIHANIKTHEFTCWKCHDPHGYVPLARRDTLTTDFVVSSNEMCLSCHGNQENFQLLSDRELFGVIKKHDWLPNQPLHFKAVRCIECHSAQNNNILISHNILSKDSAISDCVKCHSQNSILTGTLYKFRTIENRKSYGFVNGAIIDNSSYVIGANHSKWMSFAGIFIIAMALLAMLVHTFFRIQKSKK